MPHADVFGLWGEAVEPRRKVNINFNDRVATSSQIKRQFHSGCLAIVWSSVKDEALCSAACKTSKRWYASNWRELLIICFRATNAQIMVILIWAVCLFFLSFTEEVNRLRERERERQELSQGSSTERRMENWKREVGRELSSLRGHITTAMSLGNLEERCDWDEALGVVGVTAGRGDCWLNWWKSNFTTGPLCGEKFLPTVSFTNNY